MARLTPNIPTRDTTPLKAMEMVVTPMAIGTMAETRETTPMEITVEAMVTTMEAMEITMEEMDTRMEEMVSTITTWELIGIFGISHVSSVGRLDTLQMITLKTSKMRLPSPIHSRRDM
jgi:hypothetical protein